MSPIYIRIKDEILKEIQNQKPNTPILSERELERKFNASRMTVRKAIDLLVLEGYLYRTQNIGTFVADSKLHKDIPKHKILDSFNVNLEYKILYFDVKSNNADVCKKLEIKDNENYLRIVRINFKNNLPQSIDQIYIVRQMVDDEMMNNIRSVFEFSAKVEMGSVNQVFKPMLIPIKFAKLLNIKMNTPIICVESKVNTKNGRIYAYIESYTNPEATKIELTL